MAWLNMFDTDQHQALYTTARISFSNDFADSQHPINLENSYRQAPVSSDFQFSVPNYPTLSADELFFKGKILPLKGNITKAATLRDELLSGDNDNNYEDTSSSRLTQGSGRWKEKLGLKRSPKKASRNTSGALEIIDEKKTCKDGFVKSKGERNSFWT